MTTTLTESQVLETLRQGTMVERGLLPYSSNHSFLVVVQHDGVSLPAVYKPQRGENPLWDFEWGTLCKRETAAFQVSQALGWDLVPPTVLAEGTRGIGSVQMFVDHDSNAHYFTVSEDARCAPFFRRCALFDYVVNNADRKSGHCLIGADSRVWAIDHGICFHTDYKLRTVIWEFSCQPIELTLLADLRHFHSPLVDERTPVARQLGQLLSRAEIATVAKRTASLVRAGSYPAPVPQRRNYPWPPI
jgi:hypothetical protein